MPTTVVWLNEWRPAENTNEATPEPEQPRQAEAPSPAPENAPATAPEESRVVPIERPTAPGGLDEPAPIEEAPVDWEKERREAVARVLEQREQEDAYATFSLDDLDDDVPREEPIPPTAISEAMADNCIVVKNKFQRFAALMIGRCVRAPRGDLFANIKPEYLRKQPVCAETRAGQPAVVDARGNEISTVKCRLVNEDESAAAFTDE